MDVGNGVLSCLAWTRARTHHPCCTDSAFARRTLVCVNVLTQSLVCVISCKFARISADAPHPRPHVSISPAIYLPFRLHPVQKLELYQTASWHHAPSSLVFLKLPASAPPAPSACTCLFEPSLTVSDPSARSTLQQLQSPRCRRSDLMDQRLNSCEHPPRFHTCAFPPPHNLAAAVRARRRRGRAFGGRKRGGGANASLRAWTRLRSLGVAREGTGSASQLNVDTSSSLATWSITSFTCSHATQSKRRRVGSGCRATPSELRKRPCGEAAPIFCSFWLQH
eukprot:6213412-Pleurochrysis_carterae.AAC.6